MSVDLNEMLVAANSYRRSTRIPFTMRLSRSALYAAQVFLSFFLMLVFMTYNVSIFSISCCVGSITCIV